ncbi:hypothetical protein H5410_051735 [Solanum commersonii]|uniref:Uncharacterized protein n=1 Tax=Solanum commersonii TaxID=4109 RepID=A0A9J5X1D2_SOLCO|nr:hypothetical protein H5410_051735 [Solanum commersonii]
MFLVDAGLGTPRICMQDEPTWVPINRATRFENRVGFLYLVASESLIKDHILERFFIDLVVGKSLIKERVAARFNDLVGSTNVVAELSPDNNHFENNVHFIALDDRENVIANFCDQVSRIMDATGLQLPPAWTLVRELAEHVWHVNDEELVTIP